MLIQRVIHVLGQTLDWVDVARNQAQSILDAVEHRFLEHKSTTKGGSSSKDRTVAFVSKSSGKSWVVSKKIKSSSNSVRSGKLIRSARAQKIIEKLHAEKSPSIVEKDAEIEGKKSLAWIIWALGAAESAKIPEGISVHDISSLLYQACQLELYPINISRMVHDHGAMIERVSQEKRTKRYLLTDKGREILAKIPIANSLN